MASSGLRIGSFPDLRLRNIQKIDNIYKITAYEGFNSQYFTFCTPECTSYMDAYLQFRSKYEKLDKNSYLIRDQFDITDVDQIRNRSKAISTKTIDALLNTVLIKSGLRTKGNGDRRDVARAHGFRKFFTTQVINSDVNPEIREMLLGHKIGLASCYYRPTEDKVYQEYLKAVNLLTINEENRLKRELEQKIQIEKSQIEALKADFDKFKQEVLKQRRRG